MNVTAKGTAMGAGGGLVKQVPGAARPHATGTRWLLGFLLAAIGMAGIAGVAAAAAMGQVTVALAVALVTAAFFAGMLC